MANTHYTLFSRVNIPYFSAPFRLKMIWSRFSLRLERWHLFFQIYLVCGWYWSSWSSVGASLQVSKPDMTHITSCRNIICIEHTASTVFVAFWLVLPLERSKEFYGLFRNVSLYCIYKFSTQNYIPFEISGLGLFLKYS